MTCTRAKEHYFYNFKSIQKKAVLYISRKGGNQKKHNRISKWSRFAFKSQNEIQFERTRKTSFY